MFRRLEIGFYLFRECSCLLGHLILYKYYHTEKAVVHSKASVLTIFCFLHKKQLLYCWLQQLNLFIIYETTWGRRIFRR
jgi:hypothetical protein